jgi:hypothetical protein
MAGELQPIPDFMASLRGYDAGAAIDKHVQEQAAIRAAQIQAEQLAQAHDAFYRTGSVEDMRRVMMLDPAAHQATKAAYDASDTATQRQDVRDASAALGWLQANRPDQTIALLKRRREAASQAGQPTDDIDATIEAVTADPVAAQRFFQMSLAAISDPTKVADNSRTLALLPGELTDQAAKTESTIAGTGLTQAQTDKTLAETAQVAPDAEAKRTAMAAQIDAQRRQIELTAQRLNLDAQALADKNTQWQQDHEFNATNLPAPALAAINTAVNEASAASMMQSGAANLASQLRSSNAGGGLGASVTSTLTGLTGDANTVTQLRRQYAQLMTQQAIKSLPPGPASDKDIKLVMRGFPPENASKETLVNFLDAMARIQGGVAEVNSLKADFLSGNRGNLGRATAPFYVGTTLVQPGTSFAELLVRRNKEAADAAARAAAEARLAAAKAKGK